MTWPWALGFTGTRHGMTAVQHEQVKRLIISVAADHRQLGFELATAHHGDCIGADAEFHALIRAHAPGVRIVIYPGPATDVGRQAGCVADERRAPRPHLLRNHHIVAASSMMIAAPREAEEQSRGGTWSTIRLARGAGRNLMVVLPSGVVIEEPGR